MENNENNFTRIGFSFVYVFSGKNQKTQNKYDIISFFGFYFLENYQM